MSLSEQKISEPTDEDAADLDQQRSFAEGYIADESSRQKYQTAAGKLGLINAVLSAGFLGPDQARELQALGIVLGDAFVQHHGWSWVIVEDEYGRTPAVQVPGKSVILFPMTMISKRVEAGEEVDVFDMFNGIADQVFRLP